MRKIVIDIETSDLAGTILHLIVTKDLTDNTIGRWTKEPFEYADGLFTNTFREFVEFANKEPTCWIQFNGISFDLPILKEKLEGFNYKVPENTCDLLVASRLFNQERVGGHTLRAWGETLGSAKIDFEDFSELSRAMCTYCVQDVELTHLVYLQLLKEGRGFSRASFELEMEVCEVLRRMERNGFTLNYTAATELLATIGGLKDKLEISLATNKPPMFKENRLVKYKINKDGSLAKNTTAPMAGTPHTNIVGDYTLLDAVPFNPGSRQQVVYQLKLMGWVPKKFTPPTVNFPNGQPIVDDKVLEELAKTLPEAKDIADYFMLGKRYAQVLSWIELYNHSTGRVHGRIFHIGAKTHRASHSNPNLAQVPSVPHDGDGNVLKGMEGTFSYECRNVWTVPVGYKLVGVDAASIQLVILAHAMGNKEYSDAVAFGDKKKGTDVHSVNMRVLRKAVEELGQTTTLRNGIDRHVSKTFIYAFLLGAGGAKVDEILGISGIGNKVKEIFVANTPGLGELQNKLRREVWDTKRIRNIDGRYFHCEDAHYALAFILQGYEQTIMKKALVKLQNWIDMERLEARILTWVHDEFQIEVRNVGGLPELVKNKTIEFIEEVGRELNLACFLTGDGNIADTWAGSH